jgi:hypothetical protein
MSDLSQLRSAVLLVTHMLANADYHGLEALTHSRRLTTNELARAAREYGGTIVTLPEPALQQLDIIEVTGVQPRQWNVNVTLWTVEQGASDLTLELTVKETAQETFDIEIDDLHVL